MKTVVIAAVALLVGLFVGGIGPRAEARRLEKDLAEAKENAARARSSSALPLALGMGSLMAARDRAQGVPRFVAPAGDQEAPPAASPTADAGRARRSLFGDGGAATFAAMKSAADVRAAQFRAAFIDEAALTPDKEQGVQRIIDQMNKEFAQVADEIAQTLGTKAQKVRPRDMADIGAKLLEIYRRADDSFTATLDEPARAAQARTQFDVLTQVDIGSFRRLAETMEKLGVAQPLRGAGR